MRTLALTCLATLMTLAVSCTDPGTGPIPQPDPDPSCTPVTCTNAAVACGVHADGCGGSIDCGACSTCTPRTCDDAFAACGTISDGCTGTLSCGACGPGDACSFNHSCECARQCSGHQCGDDGCGGSCGTCTGNTTCSASGTCVPHTSTPPPPQWVCNVAYWDAHDGCDCNCGALDPDCGITGQQLLGCTGLASPTCNASGHCTGGGSCNAVPTGPYLQLNLVAAAAPTMTGGAVLPGRYVATDVTRYTGPGGAHGFTGGDGYAIEITGTTWNRVTRNAGGFPNVDETFTASSSGATVSLSRSCPSAGTQTMTYTATPTSLKLAYQNSGTMVITFVKKW